MKASKEVSMARYYRGVDFADDKSNVGQCVVVLDDDGTIRPVHELPAVMDIEKTAVDSPFGTSSGFVLLYKGILPNVADAKTRATERWLRKLLQSYDTNAWWSKHRGHLTPALYVNTTGHVQPAVGLQIVPGFLRWFY